MCKTQWVKKDKAVLTAIVLHYSLIFLQLNTKQVSQFQLPDNINKPFIMKSYTHILDQIARRAGEIGRMLIMHVNKLYLFLSVFSIRHLTPDIKSTKTTNSYSKLGIRYPKSQASIFRFSKQKCERYQKNVYIVIYRNLIVSLVK